MEEEQIAKAGQHPDGTTPVRCPKRVWRPQVKYEYEEVDLTLDPNEDMDWLFKDRGKCITAHRNELPPRRDVEQFDIAKHSNMFDENIQWRDCPPEHQAVISQILKEHWDVFNPENMASQIRGYQFTIDTGHHAPITCKQPRYGPHESRVITQLVTELENKGLIEDDQGPYGAIVVLASKPNQGHVHWTKYIFRLCVSFRPLNAVTRGFEYPITRCDDAVTDVGPRSYIITGDLKAGYWQVRMHKNSKEKTGFFVPEGKKHWNVMPMGARNAHAFFVALTEDLRKKWTRNYGERGRALVAYIIELYRTVTPEEFQHKIKDLKERNPDIEFGEGNPMSVAIVDDLLWAAHTLISVLAFFKQSLEVFEHYNVTFNLKKCRFLPQRAEFVGVDLLHDGNTPAESKYDAIRNLTPPVLFSDLLLFIGLLGFYAKWIPWYEVRIKRWRGYMKKRPIIQDDKEEEAKILQELWTNEDTALFNALKQEILEGPVLRRPDFNRRFYLKTDWSSAGIGGALTQPDCNKEEESAMQQEMEGGQCEFEKSIGGLRLRPIEFAARACKGNEKDMHSAVGEALAGRWLFTKYKQYLWYKEFTWITDCKANETFFEQDLMPTHVQQRWKMDMLRFPFTCVHRPERMMYESNLLSRYNLWAAQHQANSTTAPTSTTPKTTESPTTVMFRALTTFAQNQKEEQVIPRSNVIPIIHGQGGMRTFLAELCDKGRNLWLVGEAVETFTEAGQEINAQISIPVRIELEKYWNDRGAEKHFEGVTRRMEYSPRMECDWLVITRAHNLSEENEEQYIQLFKQARQRGARAMIMMWSGLSGPVGHAITAHWTNVVIETTKHNEGAEWVTTTWELDNVKHGGALEQQTMILFAAESAVVQQIQCAESNGDFAAMFEKLDPPNSNYDDYFSYSRPNPVPANPTQQNSWQAQVKFNVDIRHEGKDSCHPVFATDRPGPRLTQRENWVGPAPFLIETGDGWLPNTGRPIRKRELLRMIGYNDAQINEIISRHEWTTVLQRLERTPPKETCIAAILALQEAEDRALDLKVEAEQHEIQQDTEGAYSSYLGMVHNTNDERQSEKQAFLTAVATRSQRPVPDDRKEEITAIETELNTQKVTSIKEAILQLDAADEDSGSQEKRGQALTRVINRWTTIPIPSDDKWREELKKDRDTKLIIDAIETQTPLVHARLSNKKYFDAWSNQQLEVIDGILYQFEEPKLKRIRQLRRRIVPEGLRQHILTAYHATPLAGHVGMYKTYWRIAVRYWWPGMYQYVRKMVRECGHCVVGNSVSHKAQQILKAISTDEPFDVIAIDIWHPGVTQKMGTLSIKEALQDLENATITSLCTTTGYATTANLNKVNADKVTQVIFTQIFVPNGLPKLILIDQDSVFKGILQQFCDLLGVRYYVCAPEEHDAILCERFHRFLNNVMRLLGADTQTLEQTISNVALATYAWNASTIDGTPVVRSFAAKARTFRFPLETQEDDNVIRIPSGQGEAALQHVETTFPLWFQQKEILKILQAERRERHLEMKNGHRKERTFQPGDLVIVRKQITSSAVEGRPEKLVLKSRGPYRVLERAGTGSYWVQKLPATQEIKRRKGRKQKEAASRMTKIPSCIVVHKRMDSADTRFISQKQDFINNPLEHNLGVFDFGQYFQAPPNEDYAFETVQQLWNEEVEESDDESDEEEVDDGEDNVNTSIPNQREGASRRRRNTRVRFADEVEIEEPQNNDTEPQTIHIQVRRVMTERQRNEKLWRAIKRSRDKLCFIRRHEEGKRLGEWHLVQIDEEATNDRKAKAEGEYHVKYYLRQEADASKMKTRQCRHWPLLREYYTGGYLGPIIQLRPTKVDNYLDKHKSKAIWYQDTINLTDVLIWGPFSFENNTHVVPEDEWKQLLDRAERYEVDVTNVNKKSPLPTYNPRRRKRRT